RGLTRFDRTKSPPVSSIDRDDRLRTLDWTYVESPSTFAPHDGLAARTDVDSRPAVQRIDARCAEQPVVTAAASYRIVAVSTPIEVVAWPTVQPIDARSAEQTVVSAAAGYRIVAVSAQSDVIASA